ncbi:MAG: IS110 family transposase [Actinomycetota bacterium]|nr:IS110 family transposase [Actinomycetota bacterium]
MERQYVAIDLHRRRSLILRQTEHGEELGVVRIDNDPVALSLAVAEAGPNPEVAIEATYGWYWAVDLLQEEGANVHLVNPSGLDWERRRVKNDYKDCQGLAARLRLNELPEAWIAPPAVRELRELVRYRAKLVGLRTGLKAQVKAILAKHGLHPPVNDLWGPTGTVYLDELDLPHAYTVRIESLRDLVGDLVREIDMLEREIHTWLRDDTGYWAIQAINGVGRTLAAIFVAEIGDVSRFPNPQALCSWAGLTPRHRESDLKAHRGKVTKQGSKLLRWAAIEAVSHLHGGPKLQADYHRIADRRGRNVARVAVARKLLTLVYYGLRDGEIRCLAQDQAAG